MPPAGAFDVVGNVAYAACVLIKFSPGNQDTKQDSVAKAESA